MTGTTARNFYVGSRMLGAYLHGSGTTNFYHANALGSSTVITDGTGAVQNEQLFYPWGDVWQATQSQLWFHFAGFDWGYSQTGLDPTPFRMYSYGKGRWMTPDPAGLAAADITNPDSFNRYAYVGNNPMTFTDPLGLQCVPDGMGGVTDDGTPPPCGGIQTITVNGGMPPPVNPLAGCYIDTSYCVPEINGMPSGGAGGSAGGPTPFGDLGASPAPSGGPGGGTSACEAKNLNAVNNKFGTNFTSGNVTGEFQFSTGAPPGQGTLNLNISGGGVSPGRYPVNWWTYIIGYGPTLHIPAGPGGLDSSSTLDFSSSQFTEHLDSAFPYNPFGAIFHLLIDVKGIGGYKACP